MGDPSKRHPCLLHHHLPPLPHQRRQHRSLQRHRLPRRRRPFLHLLHLHLLHPPQTMARRASAPPPMEFGRIRGAGQRCGRSILAAVLFFQLLATIYAR